MSPLVLPEKVFDWTLNVFFFGPLLLLFGLPLIQGAARRWRAASFILFLPSVLMIGLWMVTGLQTEPKMADIGVAGLMIFGSMWILFTSVLSLAFGACCVRSQRVVLLWMVPEIFMILGLVVFLLWARRVP